MLNISHLHAPLGEGMQRSLRARPAVGGAVLARNTDQASGDVLAGYGVDSFAMQWLKIWPYEIAADAAKCIGSGLALFQDIRR